MTLPLNKEMLAAAYDYLRTTPPFAKWNLPEGEDVMFAVVRDPAVRGWYRLDEKSRHSIGISTRCIGRTDSLLVTMAHEMVHLFQRDARIESPRAEHNAAFNKLAERVCKRHGWDPLLF